MVSPALGRPIGLDPSDVATMRRFHAKVAVDGNTGCHVWQGALNSSGYGCFGVRGKSVLAHRWAVTFDRGEIPEGMTVDHRCFNKRCVNPSHLDVVPMAVNNRRYADTITHCVRGHDLAGAHIRPDGKRACRQCQRIHHRASYARHHPVVVRRRKEAAS